MMKRQGMAVGAAAVGGAVVGALAMYLADTRRGARRRAEIRSQVGRLVRRVRRKVRVRSRDAWHRSQGIVISAASRFKREEISDDKLASRVRARMGRAVTHPGMIQVSATDGCVTLAGRVFESERDELIAEVQKVRGVREVEDCLDIAPEQRPLQRAA